MDPQQTYMVECFWPGVTTADFRAAAERVAPDDAATCLDLILIPADEILLLLFQADSRAAVRDASRRAGLRADRVIETLRIRGSIPEPRRDEAEVHADPAAVRQPEPSSGDAVEDGEDGSRHDAALPASTGRYGLAAHPAPPQEVAPGHHSPDLGGPP